MNISPKICSICKFKTTDFEKVKVRFDYENRVKSVWARCWCCATNRIVFRDVLQNERVWNK